MEFLKQLWHNPYTYTLSIHLEMIYVDPEMCKYFIYVVMYTKQFIIIKSIAQNCLQIPN